MTTDISPSYGEHFLLVGGWSVTSKRLKLEAGAYEIIYQYPRGFIC